MGNSLSGMQQEMALAHNSERCKDARETFERVEEMAQDRIDLFYQQIGHDDFVKHLIPVNKVVHKYTYVGITSEDKPLDWDCHVAEAVNEFSSGPIAEGLSFVGAHAIKQMLGASSGRRQMTERYAISIDCLGGISRLDYMIFTYSFSCSEWAEKKVSLVACCVVESSAFVTDFDCNTIRVIVSRAFKGGDVPLTTLSAIYAQVVMATQDTKKILSLTEAERSCLELWHKATDRRMLTHGSHHSGSSSPLIHTQSHQEEHAHDEY